MKQKKTDIILEEFDGNFFQMEFFTPENFALVTHYIHNYRSNSKNFYEKDALNLINKFVKYEQKKKSKNVIAEEAIQKLLFDVENVPFPSPENYTFKFIDLFAGIGGFRLALQNLGGKCIFTSEWDKNAQKVYRANFGELPFGDITKKNIKEKIPTEEFDVLCAGFPCQPFSKGGFQNGFEDTRGTLFFDICEIIEKHKPKFLLLENVANLVTHDNKNTFKVILKNLQELGYTFPKRPLILSPHSFGLPVLRPRIYIPCVRNDIADKNINFIQNFDEVIKNYYKSEVQPIDIFIDKEDKSSNLSQYELKVLEMWDDFYNGIDIKVIGFPIWVEYFNFEGDLNEFPEWKVKFIKKNIELYKRNKPFIDRWLKKYDYLNWVVKTHRKLEWQAGNHHKSVYETLIQFRPSGVRVKKADKFSTLVAMNHQQIIGKLKRKISINESKLLQSFPKNFILSNSPSIALKQLGNAINVNVIEIIFKLIKEKYYD